MRFVTCGDAALAVQFDELPSPALARRIGALREALASAAPNGIVESVPGLTSLTVLFDPALVSATELELHVGRFSADDVTATHAPRRWRIPVCYARELAPDIEEVAAACGISVADVVALHSERTYVVYLLGFSPGFPYMGDLDRALVLPRRASPRQRVPAGSVSIADTFTAIYPQSTAGGWHLIGATPVTLFDATATPPAVLSPADTVTFEAITLDAYERLAGAYAAGQRLLPE